MPLYDKQGREQYFSSEEVVTLLTTYSAINSRRNADSSGGSCDYYLLLKDIRIIKKIPASIRNSLPTHFGLTNKELSKLEQTCKKHIPLTSF